MARRKLQNLWTSCLVLSVEQSSRHMILPFLQLYSENKQVQLLRSMLHIVYLSFFIKWLGIDISFYGNHSLLVPQPAWYIFICQINFIESCLFFFSIFPPGNSKAGFDIIFLSSMNKFWKIQDSALLQQKEKCRICFSWKCSPLFVL